MPKLRIHFPAKSLARSSCRVSTGGNKHAVTRVEYFGFVFSNNKNATADTLTIFEFKS